MVFTDPPYNVPIAGHVSGKGKTRHREFFEASGEMTRAGFTAFLDEVLASLPADTVERSGKEAIVRSVQEIAKKISLRLGAEL